jgi:hypothetical protein
LDLARILQQREPSASAAPRARPASRGHEAAPDLAAEVEELRARVSEQQAQMGKLEAYQRCGDSCAAANSEQMKQSGQQARCKQATDGGTDGWAHPCHMCTGTALTTVKVAPGPGSPLPHLRRGWARRCPHLQRDLANPRTADRNCRVPHFRHSCLRLTAATGLNGAALCTVIHATTIMYPIGTTQQTRPCRSVCVVRLLARWTNRARLVGWLNRL